jgi:tetratricopeptide (TPR) repeat protein
MNKKPKGRKPPLPARPAKVAAPVAPKAWYKSINGLLPVALILVITYICYSPALSSKKEFTNWDDPGYVLEQPLVKNLSSENIKKLFAPSTGVMLNYHPLTMLTLAWNYSNSKLNARPYVLTNIILHLLNTFLVFVFIFLLSQRRFWIAALSALWFGTHPMHVESVAWIAERKDVLYAFFFLFSCITYLKYLESKKVTLLVLVFILFVLSCLSKAMAVPLAVVLILFDFYFKRKLDAKVIAEKVPFILFALWVGWNAVKIQSQGAIADYQTFSTVQRMMFASYGFLMYLVKLFVPVNLSAVYPYPSLDDNNGLPLIYNLSPLIVLLIVILHLFLLRKKKDKQRVFIFGVGFYFLMVALVLQFVSVGIAIIADRYSYVPYIGIFFILAYFVNELLKNKKTKTAGVFLAGLYSVFTIVLCYARVPVWTNTETLFTDVIEKHPYKYSQEGNIVTVTQVGVETAYKNRGNYYREHDMMDKAFDDYNVLVTVHSKEAGAYSNMGNMYAMRQQYDKSLAMYSEALKVDPQDYDTYINRAVTYGIMGRHIEAEKDFETAAMLRPNLEVPLEKIAFENLQLKNFPKVLETSSKLLQMNPQNFSAYYYRGIINSNSGKSSEAETDFQHAVSIRPDYPEAWFNYSLVLQQVGKFTDALNAAEKAKAMGFAPANDEYLNKIRKNIK